MLTVSAGRSAHIEWQFVVHPAGPALPSRSRSRRHWRGCGLRCAGRSHAAVLRLSARAAIAGAGGVVWPCTGAPASVAAGRQRRDGCAVAAAGAGYSARAQILRVAGDRIRRAICRTGTGRPNPAAPVRAAPHPSVRLPGAPAPLVRCAAAHARIGTRTGWYGLSRCLRHGRWWAAGRHPLGARRRRGRIQPFIGRAAFAGAAAAVCGLASATTVVGEADGFDAPVSLAGVGAGVGRK